MPPEPLPWDRKEFKDRKHETGAGSDATSRGVGGGGGGSGLPSRWREPYHGPRDYPLASPRRSFQGNHRHAGGYHQPYPEEFGGHWCTPSRSGDRIFPEDEIFRRSSGRYGRGSRSSSGAERENRGSCWRSPYLDSGGGFPWKNHDLPVTAQRSVVVPVAQVSMTSTCPIALKVLHEKSGDGVGDVGGTRQKYDRDHSPNSIDWNPIKLSRPGLLPSSKKVTSGSEEVDLEISLTQGKETPLRSPVTSSLRSDDCASRKKPRLGWGQGLAKYEKQKVEGSVDISCQDGLVQSTNSAKDLVSDSSPRVVSRVAGSMSPATPTSATCSSSPAGLDIKLLVKDLNVDADKASYNVLSNLGAPNSLEEFSIKLDQLDANCLSALDSVLSDLMQPEDACSGDSSFTRYATVNKLLLLKKDISKEIEKTECEIDLLENELKSLQSEVLGVGVDAVDDLKALSELSFYDKCVQTLQVIHEVGSTCLSDDNGNEVNDTIHDYSGAVLLDSVKSSCLERQSSNSINVQSTVCPVINILSKQGSDAQPLIQPSVEVSADACRNDACTHAALACFDISTIRKADYDLVGLIMVSNRNAAKRASQVFDKAIPPSLSQFNFWESDKFLQCRKNYMFVREKVAWSKCLSKFKEHSLVLKFRALHQLWREDLHLLSMRNHRTKSNKRLDVCKRTYQSSFQKHPSFIRSWSALPAGNITLVPTIEMLNFTSKLLSDSKLRVYRNNLKMPAEITDVKERRHSRFFTNNGLVDDPPSFEKARMSINPWTNEEKLIFLDLLATFGKYFRKISSFLSHKTTADCIEFYYKNHKCDDFTEAKKRLKLRNQWQNLQSNMYLMTPGSRLNREANAASLDLLGETSLIEAQRRSNNKNVQKHDGKLVSHDRRMSSVRHRSVERVSSVEISGNEKETVAADVLAGIGGALSLEAMSSSITSSVDPAYKVHFATLDQCPTSEVTQTIVEEDTCSDECSGEFQSADWTDEEKSMFIRALNIFGKDFIKISNFLRTRSSDQCKIFFSKSRKCLGLDVIQSGSGNGATPQSDVNGGRSDTDDGFAAEIDSAICCTQSCSKMDPDVEQSMLKCGIEGCVYPGNTTPTNTDKSCEQCKVARSTPDEFVGKIDKHNLSVNEDNIVVVRGNSHLGEARGIINCAELISNEHGASETLVHAELRKVATGYVLSPAKPAAKLHVKDNMTELQAIAEVSKRAACEKIMTDKLKGEVGSKRFGLLLDSVVKSHSSLLIEVAADVGDPLCFSPNLELKYNPFDVVDPKKDCASVVSSLNVHHQVPVELLRLLHNRASVKPEESGSVLPTAVIHASTNSSSMSSDGVGHVSSQPNLNFQNLEIKRLNGLDESGTDFTQKHVLKYLSAKQADLPLNVIQGFPFQLSNENLREMKVDKKIDENSSPGNPLNENSTGQSNIFPVPRMNNEKCALDLSSSRTGDKSNAFPTVDQSSFYRMCLQGDSSTGMDEHSQRTGDVKLFGQILTHPSSQKQCSSREVDIIPPSCRKNESATTKTSSWVKDASIFETMENCCFLHQQGELPLRSYGFWDGSRIQTGFPSPESALKLAKYQGSFTGLPLSTVIDTVTNRTVSRDFHQQAYIQPLSADKKLIETIPGITETGQF